MAGFAIGLICGGMALFCLRKVTAGITSGNVQTMLLPLFGNILSVAAGLLLTALLFRDQLAWCGAAMAGTLIVGSVIIFIIRCKKV